MLGNDWRITRALLRKRPGKPESIRPTSPKDSTLIWSLFVGLLVSFAITILIEPDLPSLAYDSIFQAHGIAVLLSFVLSFLLYGFPYGARIAIVFAVLLAAASGLSSSEHSALLPIPLGVFAIGIAVLAFHQMSRLSMSDEAI